MTAPPLSDLDALSLDELKKLVVELLVRMSAQEEEIRQLREENARLKDLPKKPKLAAWTRRANRSAQPRAKRAVGAEASGRAVRGHRR